MKIALASAPVMYGKTDRNLQVMIDYIEEYSGKADLILFGESVLQGFDSLCWDYKTDKMMAVALSDTPIRRVREAARKNGIAVSFGFIERVGDVLYSSQIFIGADGRIENIFHRVSVGWKDSTRTDEHYREGDHFEKFCYGGKSFAVGLCGDLWTDGRPEEMKELGADVVLWPVWCDYKSDDWNARIKYEYAEQAALCGGYVLLVNPFCADADVTDAAAGGAVFFQNGHIAVERPFGESGVLLVEV